MTYKDMTISWTCRLAALVALATPNVSASMASEASLPAVLAYTRPDTYEILETRDVLVPMRDGFSLTCDLYRPALLDNTAAPGKFPGIVVNYTAYGRIYHGPYQHNLRNFAKKGYNVIWCNVRGANGMGGGSPAPSSKAQVTPFQPQEQTDNYDLIEWFAARPWSTGRIGQIGTSYGGVSTFMVAGRQQPPSLKAIIPIDGVTNVYRHFPYPGGIRAVGGNARGGWVSGCSQFTGEPTCSKRLGELFAAHPTYDSFWQGQTIDPVGIKAATLVIASFDDFFIEGIDGIPPALAARDDFALLIGPWEHGVPENNANNPLSTGVYLAWFDRWLRGDEAPRFPKVIAYEMPEANVQSDQWRTFSAWPPKEAQAQRLYLQASGRLSGSAPTAQKHASSYSVQADGNSGTLSFVTDAFAESKVVAGAANLTVTAAFSASDGHIVATLFDVAPDGTTRRLGWPGYLKASHHSSDSQPSPLVQGKAYQLKVRIPDRFWRVEKGHRLLLTVSSADAVVAPAPAGTVTMATGKSQSFLDLLVMEPAAQQERPPSGPSM